MKHPTRSIVWFSAKTRSYLAVVKAFNVLGSPIDNLEAQNYIRQGLLELTEADFCRRSWQWESVVDIYGVVKDGIPWFIKFYIGREDGENFDHLSEISFHPANEDMHLESGVCIKAVDKFLEDQQ